MSSQTPTQLDESTTGRHIPAFDGVRGLALLLVLALHMLWSNPIVEGSWIVHFFAKAHLYGWVGVDLFFVLSGFLITGILYDTLQDKRFFRNFYARRAVRIFPLYYAFLLLVVVLVLGAGYHVAWSTYARILTYTVNLSIRVLPPPTNAPWINLNHFWSLAVEEQFYLVWPCLVFLLRTRKRIATGAVCGALLSLLTRLLLVHFGMQHINPYLLLSWMPSHLDGLFMGALLAMVVRGPYRAWLLRWSSVLLVLAAVAVVFFDRAYPLTEEFAGTTVLVWGIPLLSVMFALLIASALKTKSVAQRFFAWSPMRFFGRYSYGAYVFHYSITEFCSHKRPVVLAATHSKLLSVMLPATVAFVVTMVLAWLSFNLFEKRFLALKGRFHAQRSDATLRDALHES